VGRRGAARWAASDVTRPSWASTWYATASSHVRRCSTSIVQSSQAFSHEPTRLEKRAPCGDRAGARAPTADRFALLYALMTRIAADLQRSSVAQSPRMAASWEDRFRCTKKPLRLSTADSTRPEVGRRPL